MDTLVARHLHHYLNVTGEDVLLIEIVQEGSVPYEAGYRFADRAGNYYTENGKSHRPEQQLISENTNIIRAGCTYINNLGRSITLYNVEPDTIDNEAFLLGFELTDNDGEYFNMRGETFSGDIHARIIMSKEAYDAFLQEAGMAHMTFKGCTLIDILQMITDAKLKVEIGEAYVNSDGIVITIAGEYPADDPYLQLGFQFYDADGNAYKRDGKSQSLSLHLDRKYNPSEGLRLQKGKFYRNKLGNIAFMVDLITQGQPGYDNHFRMVDHRGTSYSADGSVQSTIWGKLDVVACIPVDKLTEEEIVQVHTQSDIRINALNRSDRISQITQQVKKKVRFAAPFVLGQAIGLGVAMAMSA